MAPKKQNNNNSTKGKGGKNRDLAAEEEDFDQLLSQLKKATRSSHAKDAKQKKHEEAAAAEAAKRRKEVANKPDELDMHLERQNQQRALQQLIQQMMAANSAHLSSPATDVTVDTLEGKTLASGKRLVGSIAVAEMQGWRSNMEDAHCTEVKLFDNAAFFAVFDGHAGDQCAKQAKVLLPALVMKHLQQQVDPVNFREAYHELDAVLRGRLKDDSGCTAVGVYVTESVVSCANVGDSRAVLGRRRANGGFETVALSDDHKPELEHERARIQEAGGRVENNRVNGMLAMSRAIGDYSYKTNVERPVEGQLVIPTPDIMTVPRSADDAFLVLACDGIFDVLSNEELVATVAKKLAEQRLAEKTPLKDQLSKEGVAKVCESICQECLAPAAPDGKGPGAAAGSDNMTIMIVLL